MKKRNIVVLICFVTLVLTAVFKEYFRVGIRAWACIFFFLVCGGAGLLYKRENSLCAIPYLGIAIIGCVQIIAVILQYALR